MKAIAFKYSVEAQKRHREKINTRWLYIWVGVLGAASIPWAAWQAYNWRGYKAIGGEILIPLIALLLVFFIKQIVEIRREMGEWTKQN